MKTLVIIPDAGLATRMQPLSATMSKAMIPVCGKPILARILKKLEKEESGRMLIFFLPTFLATN